MSLNFPSKCKCIYANASKKVRKNEVDGEPSSISTTAPVVGDYTDEDGKI